jgi:hypothetical protein
MRQQNAKLVKKTTRQKKRELQALQDGTDDEDEG